MMFPLPWHHVHLTHPNREEVAIWYTRYLGARRGEATKRSENLWYGKNLVQIQSDTVVKPPKTGEFDHIGLSTQDIKHSINTAIDASARQIGEDLITDPWGTRIQFVQSSVFGFHHVLINCTDPSESVRWYAVNLGGEVITCPWNKSYLAVQYDTMWMVFGRGEKGANNPLASRPVCHTGWYTDDIDKVVERMISNGCQFPIPVRPFGTVRLAFAEDPSGLWVELVELPGGKIPK